MNWVCHGAFISESVTIMTMAAKMRSWEWDDLVMVCRRKHKSRAQHRYSSTDTGSRKILKGSHVLFWLLAFFLRSTDLQKFLFRRFFSIHSIFSVISLLILFCQFPSLLYFLKDHATAFPQRLLLATATVCCHFPSNSSSCQKPSSGANWSADSPRRINWHKKQNWPNLHQGHMFTRALSS